MTSKLIKASLLLFVSILFLTACSSNNLVEPTTASETQQESSLNQQLDEKIANKQKYIVIHQEYHSLSTINYQTFIEKQANFMNSKNYKLTQQNITFTRYGELRDIILTFEYIGQ